MSYAYVLGVCDGKLTTICAERTVEKVLEQTIDFLEASDREYSKFALLYDGLQIEELIYTPPTGKGRLERTGSFELEL